MQAGRVQATIFLPPPVDDVIDELRQRWDPSSALRIAPHVTVLHHAESARPLQDRLAQIAPALAPFRLRIGRVERWPDPDHGIYLAVDDVDHGLARLRNLLATATGREPRAGYTPHVTLAHARTVHRAEVERAWMALRNWELGEMVTVDTVSVIESTTSAWLATGAARLGPP